MLDKESLKTSDANLALHHACRRGWYDIVIYILGESDHGVAWRNSYKYLPIELLIRGQIRKKSVGFVAAVDLLLLLSKLVGKSFDRLLFDEELFLILLIMNREWAGLIFQKRTSSIQSYGWGYWRIK